LNVVPYFRHNAEGKQVDGQAADEDGGAVQAEADRRLHSAELPQGKPRQWGCRQEGWQKGQGWQDGHHHHLISTNQNI
jgi:hypothetical protein